MLKALFFDVGGVILDLTKQSTLNIPDALAALFNFPETEAFVLWRNNRDKLITGKETPYQFLTRLEKILGADSNTDKRLKLWEAISRKDRTSINWEVMDIVEKVRKTVKIYIFSDGVHLVQEDDVMTDIFKRFDGCFLSYQEGFSKSQEEAYLNVLQKTDLCSQDCLLIDDDEKNIALARSLGINAFLYTAPQVLKTDLNQVGFNL